jgi:hypothetical protein
MADATVLKTVGLITRTGSSPVSGTIRKRQMAAVHRCVQRPFAITGATTGAMRSRRPPELL